MNPLIGLTVIAVWLAKDRQAIKFDVKERGSIIARADGDCCSYSWIESLDAPEALIGTVTNVEDIPMPDSVDPTPGQHDVVSFYGCKITTNKGWCVIDYRNDSNGYYGGNLSWGSNDYFYGGVHGQNISKEQWEKIA